LLNAQQPAMQSSTSVPRLVSYAGRALDAQGKPIAGTVGATFAIYKEQSEGAPLWLETQNLQTDARGNYSVELGATKPEGLPLELFSAGESRWLGVRLNGSEEQARVLLLSVPYALKAADAETVGGLPASAFLLAAATNGNATATATSVGANSVSTSAPPSVSGTGATLLATRARKQSFVRKDVNNSTVAFRFECHDEVDAGEPRTEHQNAAGRWKVFQHILRPRNLKIQRGGSFKPGKSRIAGWKISCRQHYDACQQFGA
jgi:hypothetical protein